MPSSIGTRWVYRTLHGNVGPVGFDEFQRAVNNGEVTRQTLVRRADQLEWISAAELDGLSFPSSSPFVDVDDTSTSASDMANPATSLEMQRLFLECLNKQKKHHPPAAPVQVRSADGGLLALVASVIGFCLSCASASVCSMVDTGLSFAAWSFRTKVGRATLIALAFVLMIPLLMPRISEMFLTQSVIHTRLKYCFDELIELRTKDVNVDALMVVQKRTQKLLDAVLPKIARMASTSDPASMSLLWVARDYLPKMMAEMNSEPSDTEQKIRTHLRIVENQFRKTNIKGPTRNLSGIVILTFDVLAACSVAVYFGRKWLSR
jgi:hypothetical protein